MPRVSVGMKIIIQRLWVLSYPKQSGAGAVYVFSRSDTTMDSTSLCEGQQYRRKRLFWAQRKPKAAMANTLAVGALQESSNATGIIDADEDNKFNI